MTKALEAKINGYITNPGDRLLVILDNDSGIALNAVKQCCEAARLNLYFDGHYSSNLPVPSRNSPNLMYADVLLVNYIALLADLSDFDGVVEKTLQSKDTYKKTVIIIGGFDIPKDSVWKDNERLIILDINTFDFWLKWAKSKDQHDRSNIHPLITDFLEQHPEWLEPCPKKGQLIFATKKKWKDVSNDIYKMVERKLRYKYPETYRNAKGQMLDDESKKMLLMQLKDGRVPNGWHSLDPNDKEDIKDIIAIGAGVDTADAFIAFLSTISPFSFL